MVSPLSALIFCAFLLNLCWAQDVVGVNDTRLVTVPPTLWTGTTVYHPACGGIRWIWGSSQSVSLTFTGTKVTINFMYAVDGWIGQISIDGTYAAQVNTNKAGVGVTDCMPVTWTSSNLTVGTHTVSVASTDSGNPAAVWVTINSFVYTPAAIPSTSSAIWAPTPTQTSTSKHKSSKIATIVGGVVGAIGGLLLFLFCTAFLHQRRRSLTENVTLDTAEQLAVNPTFSSLTGISGYNGIGFQDQSPRYEVQPFQPESMLVTPVTQALSQMAYSESVSPAHPLTIQGDTHNGFNQGIPVIPTLPDDRSPLHMSPLTSADNGPTNGLLSENQLAVVQRLVEWNVPEPAVTAVVTSLRSGDRNSTPEPGFEQTSGSGQRTLPPHFEDAPPRYDFKEP